MTSTEGREPSGLIMVSLSHILNDVCRYLRQEMTDGIPFDDPLTFEEMSKALCGNAPLSAERIDRFVAARRDLNGWINRRGMTILHVAASYGDRYAIIAFVRAGADLNRQDDLGYTPLHHAVGFDFVVSTQDGELPSELPTARACIRSGADPKIEDKDGNTAAELIAKFDGMTDVLRSEDLLVETRR